MAEKSESKNTFSSEIARANGDSATSSSLEQRASQSSSCDSDMQLSRTFIKNSDIPVTAREAPKQECSFIDAFFGDENLYDRDLGDSRSWRQTALQRHALSNGAAEPKSETGLGAKSTLSAKAAASPEAFTIPSSQALVDNYPYPKVAFESTVRSVFPQEPHRSSPGVARSVFEKLRKLPVDDMDLLCAEDIRAAMGRKHRGTKFDEAKNQDRGELEAGYIIAKPLVLDEVVEGHVLNNFHVRRTQQALEQAKSAASQTSKLDGTEAQQDPQTSNTKPFQMESSIDRMRRWIEEGGTALAEHFWQSPIEAGAPSKADLQFLKQMAGLAKGRRAREHIMDDLETDLPMCRSLLTRLKNDENNVEYAASVLRLSQKTIRDSKAFVHLKRVGERDLRDIYEGTENQLQSACQALRDLDDESIKKCSNAFKRRLGIASRIIHKSQTLTRMLTSSAQARRDERGLESSKSELYSDVLTRLAILRDTQLALARLIDHAVQTYKVSFKPVDEALSKPPCWNMDEVSGAPTQEVFGMYKTAGTKLLAQTAATVYLHGEAQSQKATMQDLPDEGHTEGSDLISRLMLDKKDPLAHSLFRPFISQLEGMRSKNNGEEKAERLKEAFKKAGDRELVQEVRRAYEDIYGPITVEHRQNLQAEGSVSAQAEGSRTVDVLKEDHNNQQAVAPDEVANLEQRTNVDETTGATPTAEKAKHPSGSDNTISALDNNSLGSSSSLSSAAEARDEPSQCNSSYSRGSVAGLEAITTETGTTTASAKTLPKFYTILVHDPRTDTMSMTTSASGSSYDTLSALPLHQALSTLRAPARFVPYLTPGLEVVTARRYMLVLRDAHDHTVSTRGFETIETNSPTKTVAESLNNLVNPVDGTSRLSPTGYSGIEQSREQLEMDFDERRQTAAATEAARHNEIEQQPRKETSKKRKGSVGGVFKTAIWAGALCYIVGVTLEVLR